MLALPTAWASGYTRLQDLYARGPGRSRLDWLFLGLSHGGDYGDARGPDHSPSATQVGISK